MKNHLRLGLLALAAALVLASEKSKTPHIKQLA
jgi:hypothetical protein